MTQSDTIRERLKIINVLEAVELGVSYKEFDSGYVYSIYTKLASDVMSQPFVPVHHQRSRYGEPGGKLMDAIAVINKTIKEQFAPLIAEQKEAIKKLLE